MISSTRLCVFFGLATSLVVRFVSFHLNREPMDTGDSDVASRLQLILKHNRLDLLDKSRIALVMFDSRDSQNGTYWYAAAQWNSAYCNSQGHRFVYYSMHNSTCLSSNTSVVLNPVWCKVKAMQRAQQDLGDKVDFFVYMDSDAVVSQPFANFSLNDLLVNMTQKLNWNTEERPFVFNQESTVVWRSSPRATQVLERWWESALDPYETEEFTADNKTNIRFEFRTRWPWEQDRAMFLVHANDTIASYIQVAPHPHNRQMDEELVKSDWCLSNCPNRVRCFVAHNYEGGKKTKIMMRDLYTNYSQIYFNVTSSDRNFDVAFLD